MDACILPNRENAELCNLLRREFITTDYAQFLDSLVKTIHSVNGLSYDYISNQINVKFVSVANKLILDNTFQYVMSNNIDQGISLLSRRMFHHNLTVVPFYLTQISHDLVAKPDDQDEVESILVYYITRYLQSFFNKYYDELVVIITNTLMMLYSYIGQMGIKYGKFEIIEKDCPMLIYRTGELHAQTFV